MQKPNHQVAPLLKDIEFPFLLLIFFLHFYCSFLFTNRIASILETSNSTVFCFAHQVPNSVHFLTVSTISIIFASAAILDRLSMEEIPTAVILSWICEVSQYVFCEQNREYWGALGDICLYRFHCYFVAIDCQ
jgi:hypothetical protein